MRVKVYRHGIGFDTCKGASRVQNAKVKTMEVTRHDGSKLMAERARCRWCKKWMSFDLIPGEAERVARHRNIADLSSDNPSPDNPLVKQAAEQRSQVKALVEAPCWICHAEEDLGRPPDEVSVRKVLALAPPFVEQLCEHHAVELAASLMKSLQCSYCGYSFDGASMFPGDNPEDDEHFCKSCVNNR